MIFENPTLVVYICLMLYVKLRQKKLLRTLQEPVVHGVLCNWFFFKIFL